MSLIEQIQLILKFALQKDKSTVDLILTNILLSFQKTHVTEKGLIDYHKLTSTFFKASSSRIGPKIKRHRNYKQFNE